MAEQDSVPRSQLRPDRRRGVAAPGPPDAAVPEHGRGGPAPESVGQANASLRHEAEGRLLSTPQGDPLVAPDEPAVRVVALVMVAGLVGLAGWLVAYGWRTFTDVLEGRIPKDVAAYTWPLLALIVLLPPVVRRLWLVARRGVDPESEGEGIEAVESRAFLEAVERHDTLLEAQRLAAEEVGGDLNAESRPEDQASPLYEPTGRGYEARIAAPMKERGDVG